MFHLFLPLISCHDFPNFCSHFYYLLKFAYFELTWFSFSLFSKDFRASFFYSACIQGLAFNSKDCFPCIPHIFNKVCFQSNLVKNEFQLLLRFLFLIHFYFRVCSIFKNLRVFIIFILHISSSISL